MQRFIQALIKVNIKGPRHWSLWGGRWKGPVARKIFPFEVVIIWDDRYCLHYLALCIIAIYNCKVFHRWFEMLTVYGSVFSCTCVSYYKWHCNVLHVMKTSSNGNIFRVTGPLCGEFTGPGEFPTQRPVTQSFDVFFDLRLDQRLSKQSWGWWFETLSRPLWCHCNVVISIDELLIPITKL